MLEYLTREHPIAGAIWDGNVRLVDKVEVNTGESIGLPQEPEGKKVFGFGNLTGRDVDRDDAVEVAEKLTSHSSRSASDFDAPPRLQDIGGIGVVRGSYAILSPVSRHRAKGRLPVLKKRLRSPGTLTLGLCAGSGDHAVERVGITPVAPLSIRSHDCGIELLRSTRESPVIRPHTIAQGSPTLSTCRRKALLGGRAGWSDR